MFRLAMLKRSNNNSRLIIQLCDLLQSRRISWRSEMLLHGSVKGGVKWELYVVDGWLWIVLVVCLIDTDGVWKLEWWERRHVGGERFLDEWDGEGFAVEDLSSG